MSTFNRELSYDQEIDTVVGVKFSVLSPDEITRRSVVEVTKNDTFTGNEPVVGGLFDPRMGVLETNRTCSTCQQKNLFCPGHFGHINLARPIYHPMFFDTVRKLLKCVCFRCSRPLVSSRSTKEEIRAEVQRIGAISNQQKRWEALLKLHAKIKLKRCGDDLKPEPIPVADDSDGEADEGDAEEDLQDGGAREKEKGKKAAKARAKVARAAADATNTGCQALQPSRYQKESSGLKINAEWKESSGEVTSREFTAEDVLRIMRRITDDDMKLMGFDSRWNKPEWMISTVLPVPPPSVRPSIIEESGQRREDDLTHKLCEIIKFNSQLKQRIESGKATEENLKVLTNLIQYHVATFMDNQIPGMPVAQQRNGRKLKSIADRLKKKEGRIRGNLNGKRVDQSARSVITPDPYISLDELGVPLQIAMNLTFPEVVNSYNIEFLRGLVRTGVDTWPGAKYVRRSADGVTKTLKYADREAIADALENGDTVDRHMLNGDYVLFNRQPSLHKMSMMGFKVRVMTYQTFRLPVLATGCFNADFDGDEMNLFKPQNVQTMSEVMDIAAIPYLVLNPRDAKPIVEVIQDTSVGSYRITKDWTVIDDKTMANLQMVNSYFRGVMPAPGAASVAEGAFNGKQAFSMMLPPGLFISMKNKAGESFKIENSKITSGTVDKSVFHAMSKGIIPVLFHDYGPFEVRRFLDNTQRLMCRWLTTGGFSVGISDIVVDAEISEKIRSTIVEYKGKAYEKFMEVRRGTFDNASILNNEDNFEREILNVLNALNKELGRVKLDERTNRMINMIKSGSKGKEENVAQMVAAVGQQNVDGKRVSYGFTDRTLPHYTKYDDGPEARGFVENSFITGLTPQEVFFHAMGGREGLIDTAVKSVTGDTPLIIIEDGEPKYVKIGDWIDAAMEANACYVEHYEERQLEMFHLHHDVYIPTMDDDGNMTWGELTAVTRHDPGTELYEVKTLSGRKTIVTESKSLLIWQPDTKKFKEVPTPTVKVGDFVPVTAELCDPPIIVTSVDMTKYLPKTEYVYGTDFNIAVQEMKEAQGDKFHIPRGWWNDNNGKTFTLPYPKKSLLTRATSGRSNTENVKNGCVYPYHAKRDGCLIPDTFELTYNFGVFIGIYLADGNTCESSGHVTITKSDEGVKAFVRSWFDQYSIKHAETTTTTDLGSYTETTGNSTLLARFLDMFVDKGARNKFVPDVAFAAPQEFVRGVLSGYFSGDGTISETGISAGSTSQRLMEGISMLCSRIGVFGKITVTQQKSNNLGTENIAPMNTIYIRSHWAQKFADQIHLIVGYKEESLRNLRCTETHRNFPCRNDVVLDAITEINIIDVAKYPKVYDVTVPSTLNFCVASGLNQHDTSETGYIQRRLVKAMEDAKVYYDQTVRNATGALVQYLYGEDGMDGTKIEKQFIPYIDMNTIEMDNLYHLRPEDPLSLYLTDDAMKKLGEKKEKDDKSWQQRCKEHFHAILDDKMYLIRDVFKGQKQDKIQYPIPFERIISNAVHRMGAAAKAPTDLTPAYILDKIEDLIDRLKVIRTNQGIKFLHVLVRMHLSPKPMIFRHTMSRSVFDWVIGEIERHFIEAVVHPGEMVGVIAAQSIGELSTQQTLDSFHSSGTAAAVKATSGVPRLKELLNVSKNIKTPTMFIYMKPDIGSVINPIESDDAADNADKDPRIQEAKLRSMKVKRQLEVTRIVDILDSTDVYWDPPGADGLSTGVAADAGILDTYRAFSMIDTQACRSQSPWVLRIKINQDKLFKIGLTMMDIYMRLHTAYQNQIECLFSDDNAAELIFRVRLKPDALKDVDSDDTIAALKAMEHNLVHGVLLKGVKAIKKVAMRSVTTQMYNEDTDQFDNIKEWILDTDGTNLQDILANPNVDAYRTRSNDVYEILNTLGIEAARNVLHQEFTEVVGDDKLNFRHMSLLLDTMTNRGSLMSVDRHGINRGDIGPLAKSSFEETTDMLIDASIFSQHDNINGVSANIMLGQVPPCGTGDHNIFIDETEYMRLMKEYKTTAHDDHAEREREREREKDIDTEDANTTCASSSLSLSFQLPEKEKKAIQLPTIVFK
jgi:DNA-directed RNA polymerase beta' subunit